MTRKRKKQTITKNNNIKIFDSIVIIMLLVYAIITYGKTDFANIINTKAPNSEIKEIDNGNLNVYFLDVGQADSILISLNNKYTLIDAGNNEDGKKLVNYFNNLGIKEFDYVIGTHAHEDHIGGMDDIINNFKIKTFYMPDCITTTKTFEDVLDALNNNSVQFQTPTIDSTFDFGESKFTVLYTGTDTKDLNNTSIVLKLQYGKTSFLFTGDATSSTEKSILNKNLAADVLKVGHHGSQYSSTTEFIKKVNPSYAVISVGKNNSYKHPSDTTLEKLKNYNVKVYRTDESGTILINSDGKNLNITTLNTDTNG